MFAKENQWLKTSSVSSVLKSDKRRHWDKGYVQDSEVFQNLESF